LVIVRCYFRPQLFVRNHHDSTIFFEYTVEVFFNVFNEKLHITLIHVDPYQGSLYCTLIMPERIQHCASVMAVMKHIFALKIIFKLNVNIWPLKRFLYEGINFSVSQSFRNSLNYYPSGLLIKQLFNPSADSWIVLHNLVKWSTK